MNQRNSVIITAVILLLFAAQSFTLQDGSLFAQNSFQDSPITEGNNLNGNAGPGGENLYTTFRQGGILMWPILFLGILGFTIIIERVFFYYKNRIWKTEVIGKIIDDTVKRSDAKFREELEKEIEDSLNIYANNAEKGLALLNGIGNLAPVIGFFGTVQGMIGAFSSIAAATTVNAKVVAVGIQIALITTAGGLSVAVPALAFFYFFSHLIQNMFARVDEITGDKVKHLPRFSDYDSSRTG